MWTVSSPKTHENLIFKSSC